MEYGVNMKKKLITFKVTEAMMKWIAEMMEKGNYKNRTELIVDALREFLIQERMVEDQEELEAIFERIDE